MATDPNIDMNGGRDTNTRKDKDLQRMQVSADELRRRRKGARRTALILGGVVLAIFMAFLYSGVVGRG